MKKAIIFIFCVSYIALSNAQSSAPNRELNIRDAFFALAKLSEQDIESLMEPYFCIFNDGYFSANEFDRRRLRTEARNAIEAGIASATNIIPRTYFVRLLTTLGEYDFEQGGFHIGDGRGFGGWVLNQGGVFCASATFYIEFSNGENFSFIEIDEEQASEFVRRDDIRQSRSFDRRRLAIIEFNFVIDAESAPIVSNRGQVLYARIVRATVFEVNEQGNRSNRVLKVIEE